MSSRMSVFTFLLVAGFFSLPVVASAAGIPFFGPIIPKPLAGGSPTDICPAGWGMLIVVINNIILLLLTLAIVFVAPIMVAYSGFLFVVNPVHSEGISKAKSILQNTVVGIVIALAGWLIVGAIMAVLYNKVAVDNVEWSDIITSGGASQCLDQKGTKPGDTPAVSSTPPVTVATGPGSGGSCSAPSTGACSVDALKNTCFASRVEEASRICGRESAGGNASILSGTDKLDGGSGPSYSVGLWQINLTTTPGLSVNGQSCTSAFTLPCAKPNLVGPSKPGACNSSIKTGQCGSISCQQLYQSCVAAAQDPATNSRLACALYGRGTFQPWSYSAGKCGIPL